MNRVHPINQEAEWVFSALGLLFPLVLCLGCADNQTMTLTADLPLHLEEHLDAATIVGSELPADLPQPVVWNFDEAQPDWNVLSLEMLEF